MTTAEAIEYVAQRQDAFLALAQAGHENTSDILTVYRYLRTRRASDALWASFRDAVEAWHFTHGKHWQ
jgi:oligoendopeptidase F